MDAAYVELSHSTAMIECLDSTTIDDYLMGRLTSGFDRKVEEHILLCPPCAQRVKDEFELREAFVAVMARTESDQRRIPRQQVIRNVILYRGESQLLLGSSSDVSRGRANVLVSEPIPVGELVRVRIGVYTTTATVVHCCENGTDYNVGLEIVSPRRR